MNNQEQEQKILATRVPLEYKSVLVEALQHSFPGLSVQELDEAINYSILKRLKIPKASIDNNYTKKRFDGTLLDILDYIDSCEPIVTSSGVLFKKHKNAKNPMSEMIMGFIKERGRLKKEMFKYPKGSEEFAKYNLFQLLEKLNANSVYGKIYALYLRDMVLNMFLNCWKMLKLRCLY